MPDSPEDFSAAPMTPPTDVEYAAVPAKRPVWPTVIGVIAIVLGAFGAIQGCIGSLSPLFADTMMSAMPTGAASQQIEIIQDWAAVTVTMAVMSLLLAILLLIGGIGLLNRRPWSRRICVTWAPLKIIFVIANSIAGYAIQQETFAVMQADPTIATMPAGVAEMMVIIGTVVGLLWGWALPAFLLIWFARDKIKAETAEWQSAATEPPGGAASPTGR